MFRSVALGFMAVLIFCSGSHAADRATSSPKAGTEILWDKYGIAHVYAKSTEDLFYCYGWAQAHSHGNLLLKLYGQSRGRGAEYFGPGDLDLDRWVRTNGMPERAAEWYKEQSAPFRSYLDAFAKGINDYAAKYPDRLAPEVRAVLPVSGVDPLLHSMRVVHYSFVSSQQRVNAAVTGAAARTEAGGSNAWAIAPSRSASGHALLLGNPHLAWTDYFTYYEIHLTAPGIDIYGASQVGFPVLRFVFSDYLGFNQTVNPIDAMDLYRLTTDGDRYRLDDQWKPFETVQQQIRVRQSDGSFTTVPLTVRKSVHGPVVYDRDGLTLALRVAGFDRPAMLEQYWQMGIAHSLPEFQKAVGRGHVPMYNVVYADRDGHIMYLFNGLVPKRKSGDLKFWSGIIPGDTSQTLWTGYHTYEELPKVIDPAKGYLQNTNDPPWNAAWPDTLDPDKYPLYMAPRGTSFRSESSLRLLSSDEKITFDEFVTYKHSTRAELADRVLVDLLKAASDHGSDLAKQAAGVLRQWDRHVNADSRGALLFLYWAQRFMGPAMADQSRFAVPYNLRQPLETPRGLKTPSEAAAQLEQAAKAMQSDFGALDTPWGEVMKYRRGSLELPANGGFGNLGVFRVITFGPMKERKREPIHGETYVVCVEFGKTATARALIGYGNSSQQGSPHMEDQLPFMTRKELRPVWRDRKTVEASLESRDRF